MASVTAVDLVAVMDPTTIAYLLAGAKYFTLENLALVRDETAIDAFAVVLAVASAAIEAEYVDLAEKYYKIYDDQRQFYYNNFQNNLRGELGLQQQVFAIPLYNPNYSGQAQLVSDYVNANYFNTEWWPFHANMYNDAPYTTSNDSIGNSVLVGENEVLDLSAVIADNDNYLYRYEEHRKDVYDERRWEWQNQSLNYAVKQANVAESGLATSFGFLDQATGGISDWFATQSNGLGRRSGYNSALASTGAKLAAASGRGRGLAISTNLGVDRTNALPDWEQFNGGYPLAPGSGSRDTNRMSTYTPDYLLTG